MFVGIDNLVPSQLTRERLGWRPKERGLLEDLAKADHFKDKAIYLLASHLRRLLFLCGKIARTP